MENIRNFSIIAHIDHGKSTLADRILEYTNAIEKRDMKDQVLDTMELERERGITIKMQPVSTSFKNDKEYILNIIDTPGHIDFSYEVSRSLRAVEGVLLLVDSTQGVQAQTLSVLNLAQDLNLKIIPTLTKIDMPHSRVEEVSLEVSELLGCNLEDIKLVSGKTGDGVEELLNEIVKKIPPPREYFSEDDKDKTSRALVFDFSYTKHTGINAFARVFNGSFKTGDKLILKEANSSFSLKDVGIFKPEMVSKGEIKEGMIGYFTTGIKEPGIAIVGDTISPQGIKSNSFPGYKEALPVIWASLYPQEADNYNMLHQALKQMRLTDAAFTYEEEQSSFLGKGFRCGFLGMLHLEIITERVRRESGVQLIITSPSTDFLVTEKNGNVSTIASPAKFPDSHNIESVLEPWIAIDVISPSEYVPIISQLFIDFEGLVLEVSDFKSNRCILKGEMPLREFMRQFFDRLKSATSGYASLSYKRIESRPAQVERLDILLAEEVFPAFSSVVSRKKADKEGREMVHILHDTVPRTLFTVKIQARIGGKIIASKTLQALRKDVTAKLYGGDITRKMKLREKQKKGKQRMTATGKVKMQHDVFLKVIQKRSKKY